MKKHTLLLLLLFTSFTVFSQKVRIDTTYYQGEEVVNSASGFTTFEVCEVDRKRRKIGECNRYSKSGKLVEFSNYDKDERNGAYVRYSPLELALIQGQYSNNQKNGNWVIFDMEGNLSSLEIYENDSLISSRKLDINGSTNSGEDDLVVVVEKKPTFPGGMNSWTKFLAQNLTFPIEAKRDGAQGVVLMKFIVTKEGKVILPIVIDSPHPSFSKEAIRIINLSPDWNPGTDNGKPVDSEMQFRLQFRTK
ncbi:MAG TPA: energy transducer TonB [Roseivirga sp.]